MSMNTDQKIIKNKVGVLKLAEMLGSVSQACKMMGYPRDSFYRFKELYEKGGELALKEISRRKPCIKNRMGEHIEKAIVELAVEKPALGQVRVANELGKAGIVVSPAGVRCVWLRHDLETFPKRLKALEAKGRSGELDLDGGSGSGTRAGTRGQGCPGRDRNRASRLFGGARHLLCGNHQKHRSHLSADVHRHLCQGCFR